MPTMVVMRCPRTGEEVLTGLVVDLVTFGKLLDQGTELDCTACAMTHASTKNQTWLSLTHGIPARVPIGRVASARRARVDPTRTM